MMKKNIIMLILIGTLFIVFACNKTNANMNASIGSGKIMTVKLDANPTTGFLWEYFLEDGDDKGMIEIVDDNYVSDNHNEDLVGVGGVSTYSFKGKKQGKQNLRFVYRRPWEGGETAYDVVYELSIDKNLNITCLSKMKGIVESDKELSSFPDPVFEK